LKERLTRLKTIRKLIKTYRIESQEALLGYLSREGFAVTQATLSRDLKLLKVGKLSDCLLYTSDAADDLLCVDLGGRRIIKKKKKIK